MRREREVRSPREMTEETRAPKAKREVHSRPLELYHDKRDFQRTPEPAGSVGRREGRSFVIQKHHATRLHYDFRLELGGVLKSWAVPKGPSLDPSVKRLAAHVEDHPLEYGGFEGIIPEGQYGGGKVIIWDRGTWAPVGDPEAGYQKGHLKFRLEGEKLRGGWVLLRMRARPNEPRDKNWLLIKEKDEFARSGEIVMEQPQSVVGEAGPPKVWESHRARLTAGPRRSAKTTSARGDPLPEIVEPELATLVKQPPEGDEWIHEIKFDGYRLLCRIEGSVVRLRTRHGKDWTASFPTLARAVQKLPARQALLDGELVVLDA